MSKLDGNKVAVLESKGQFHYNARWPYQFCKIDALVSELDGNKVVVLESKDHEAMANASNAVGGMGVIAADSSNPSVGITYLSSSILKLRQRSTITDSGTSDSEE